MPHTPRAGWLAGVFSLLLHGLLLLVWPDIRAHPQRAADPAPPVPLTRLVVRIVAAAPPSLASASPGSQAVTPRRVRVLAVPLTAPASMPTPAPSESAEVLAPGLDTESLRAQARQLARQPSGVASQDLPPGLRRTPGEMETPLARAIDKSARPDCRTAHAGMGLLAALPLIYDTVRDKGCKW
ncbi:hypothetical protein [Chitinimonas sp. BJYL2]|uniref:hypothetical protein n=1 Tax=Chitinimonas sp. BJYL2 TaxID=2976696 RepID=UPI0022B2FAAE|nr:hypothetical protein [Chitinimonas sp. BJYL2]